MAYYTLPHRDIDWKRRVIGLIPFGSFKVAKVDQDGLVHINYEYVAYDSKKVETIHKAVATTFRSETQGSALTPVPRKAVGFHLPKPRAPEWEGCYWVLDDL